MRTPHACMKVLVPPDHNSQEFSSNKASNNLRNTFGEAILR
jgi:hypothetical protein